MSEQNNKLPIGLLLQNAGLISAEQLQFALDMQTQYTQMRLGEILVLQRGLKANTVDFFVEKWQEVLAQEKIFPLGYYLKQAALLNDRQIEAIVREQQHQSLKFGELAVKKGWLERETVEFFVNSLTSQTPEIMSLSMLEAYNSQTLHLEKKYADVLLILTRILAWTGGIPVLTKTICQVFAKSDSNIPGGQEIQAVDRFVEGTLIRKWQTHKTASSIRAIARILVDSSRCNSQALLTEYQNILLSETTAYTDSSEQQELLLLGLVIKKDGWIKVSNIIYQQVFDRDFTVKQLEKLESQAVVAISQPEPQLDKTIVRYEPEVDAEQPIRSIANLEATAPKATNIPLENKDSQPKNNSPEPLTKIGSIVTGVAIILLVPLFLTINNYYLSLTNGEKPVKNSQQQLDELQKSCTLPTSNDLESLVSSISSLEMAQQQQQENFPDSCHITLNRLRVMAAPQLGRESRILEAIRYLCKVPPDSEMYIEAEVWLKRWYKSANWGEETKSYLEETDKYNRGGCPAAHFTEYKT